MSKYKIIGKNIFLRPLIKDDAKDLSRLANDRSIAKFTRVPCPYRLSHADDFIKKSKEHIKNKQKFNFGIFLKETNQLIGTVGFVEIDKRENCGEIGYWIGKPFRNKGYTTEAARLIVDFGFDKLNLHRIEIVHSTKNKASEKIIKDKLHAKFEGTLRKRFSSFNEWHDQKIYSILRQEYKAIRKRWH